MTMTDNRPAVGNYTDRANVVSTNLREVVYDKDTGTLYVVFLGGRSAGYRNVSESVYQALVTADSPGRYYNQFIKNYYSGVQAPEDFVLRIQTPVQDVTNNVSTLAPWVTNPVDEDVEPLENNGREFEVTLVWKAESIKDLMNVLDDLGLADFVNAVNEV